MFITKKRKYLGVISLLIAGCFMLTSCSLLPGKSNKAPEEIESVVSDYLDSIAGGDFADDSYESDLATDTPFADLEFSDEAVEEIMKSALETITYEIDEADGDQKDGEGSCDIVLTAIDVAAVTEALEGKFDAETLQAAIDDKDVPTEDHEITLDLEYDEDEEEWLISDTSELCEILGEPFAELELSSASDPMAVATAFVEALKTGDFDTASALTDGYYTVDDFIDPNYSVSSELFEAVFSGMTYDIIDPGTSSETEISYQFDFSYADYLTSFSTVSSDVQTMSDLVKPFVLAIANYEDGLVEYGDYLNALGALAVSDLQSSSTDFAETDTLDLYYDEIQETWFVEYVPYSLCIFYDLEYNIDPMYTMDTAVFDEIMLDAYNDLLASASITQAQYDEYYAPATVYDSATVLASITTQGWYDFTTDAYVTEYVAGVTSLDYDLFFSSEFSGLVMNYEFFSTNGTVSLGVNQITLDAGADYYYFSYYNADFSELAADTYRLVITLEDGSVLVDQSIAVV